MTDPIRAALEKAAEATCPTARTIHGSCAPLCIHCPRVAANAIAAFLRALPDNRSPATAMWWYSVPVEMETHHWLADAVLAAAKEDRE